MSRAHGALVAGASAALAAAVAVACDGTVRASSDEADASPSSSSGAAAPPSTAADAAPGDASPTTTDGGATALVGAKIACSPSATACAPAAPLSGVFASYRKDAFLSEAEYPETGPLPTSGGRMQIAAIAKTSGEISRVLIGGETTDSLLAKKAIDWYHVWPRVTVAGEPVWVAFHSRSASWDAASSSTFSVESSGAVLASGTFTVAKAAVAITYVTTADDGKTILVHAMNVDTKPHTLDRLVVDGSDVTAVACVPKKTLLPGEHALWAVPRCKAEVPGAAWTVALTLTDGPASAAVGRVLQPFFPIETWPNGADCALPGGAAAAVAKHAAAGFDTTFAYFWKGDCGVSRKNLINTVLPALPGNQKLLVADDFLYGPPPLDGQITADSSVAGFLTGDESDGEYEDQTGFPAAENKARMSRRLWQLYPRIATYNGGKTNKKVGAFAGMADVQGMDFYVAACAPHITPVSTTIMPIRGAFDYLRNTRNNHMPGPTWLYAQGLHSGWNKEILGVTIHVQPDPGEILVQALSIAAAGGKGAMWFQTDLSEAAIAPASWDAIARANRALRATRDWLREGDPAGLATATGKVLVEAIRARDAIVVPVMSLAVAAGPTDLSCAQIFVGGGVPHFRFSALTTEVSVRVPDDLAIDDVFEVAGETISNVASIKVVGREIRVPVTLDDAAPARLLVFASSKASRAKAKADALGP